MKTLALLLGILLLPLALRAEPIQVTYTEPAAQTGLARTCVRFCDCKQSTSCTCTDFRNTVCTNSDNGLGGDTINLNPALIWPIYEGDLPVTVRFCVNSVNTNGNETTRDAVCDTVCFGATCP
jgi:hypothetical protein